MRARSCHAAWLALASIAPTASAAVLTVAADGTADYVDIQGAVSAATRGDTIVVFEGADPYGGAVIDSLGVTLVGVGRPVVESVEIVDLGPAEPVVLRGFELRPTAAPLGLVQPGLVITSCLAPVFVEECVVRAYAVPGSFLVDDAVSIFDASAVTFVRCDVAGLDAVGDFGFFGGGPGGHGIGAAASSIAVFDSRIVGGQGGPGSPVFGAPGGVGGHAISHVGGSMFVYGSVLLAGSGGDAGCGPGNCPSGGDGGSALWTGTLNSILVAVVDSDLAPGGGGDGMPMGEPGVTIFGSENVEVLPLEGMARSFQVGPSPAAPGTPLLIELGGEPGDVVLVFAGLAPGRTVVAGFDAPLALDAPLLVGGGALTTLGAAGIDAVLVRLPSSLLGLDLDVYLQAVFRDGSGMHVGPPSVITLGPTAP